MNTQIKKSNVISINNFTTFLQNNDVTNSYLFSFEFIINIIFSLTNNHLSHHQFVKKIVKYFVVLALKKKKKHMLLKISDKKKSFCQITSDKFTSLGKIIICL